MKVYIEDEKKLSVFSLPTKIEDEFVIDYLSPEGIEETITLVADGKHWNISSDIGTEILLDNVQIKTKPLLGDNIFKIKFSDLENKVSLYCFDTPTTYYNYSTANVESIVLGSGADANINYAISPGVIPKLKITKQGTSWFLEEDMSVDSRAFVNRTRASKRSLHLGDVIFIGGLKIIWMDKYISINNPNNSVQTRLSLYEEQNIDNVYTPVKDTEKNASLYSEKDVFFHTPRLKSDIVEKTVKIENPPAKKVPDETPAILTYGATVLMSISSSITGIIAVSNVVSGKSTFFGAMTEIFLSVSMLAGGLLFPFMQDKYRKSKIKKEEKKRQERYTAYLNKKVDEINTEIKNEMSILIKNNLSVAELENAIEKKSSTIWSREIPDNDFLTLRLGLGNIEASIKVDASLEEFTMEDDNLREEVAKIKDTKLFLNNVPIVISLIENTILPIVISDEYKNRDIYVRWLALQLISYYSGADLKIAIFTDEEHEPNWDFYKYLSHSYIYDRSLRLFATNEDEYKNVLFYLEEEFNARTKGGGLTAPTKTSIEKDAYKEYDHYYLLITDNYIGLKNYELIKKLLNQDKNAGFSFLIIESTMSNIPSRSKCFIDINNSSCTIYNKSSVNQSQQKFTPEFFFKDIDSYSRLLANIPAVSLKQAMSLPTSYNFLEMYKVGKIEQLNVVNRWLNNDPTQSLDTPIGIKEDGKLMKLDLHEKFHGPHGLIAGSTGSGKSEFIITFILSMAINYHPYEVQFILIDYKGGGLAGAFENRLTGIKIPHLVGTITNLDTNEMNRTLVSINSELKRRERIFNEARDKLGESTVDIYKYQKFYREGRVKEPISHLFIISDEFAELKSQQPEFMDELVSTARIGRSLGVHLILATQKPSGVVNDQIWSNARFKICLKVQTAADSTEMLKRPEAAAIKETGRFYLQVGYDELFMLAQSAWAGAKYIPTERILKSYDDSINIIDNNGTVVKNINDRVKEDNAKDYGDQLTNIVKFLYAVAQRENIKMNTLWLPSIPPEIYLSNLIKKYSFAPTPYKIDAIIGEYDNPASQIQGLLTIDLTNTGNVAIFGVAGSGKENMLATIIYSTCVYHTPEEVNFYIFDFGAETLKMFSKMPHVADVTLIDEKEKIKSGLLFFERELGTRRERFSEYGGSYTSYISHGDKKMPLIVVVINSYETMFENYIEYVNYLNHLFRDGYKYGIIFVVTANGTNSISSSVQQNFANKVALQLAEDFEYKYTFKAPYGLVPAKCFGRGIITLDDVGYEFQTAYIYYKNEIGETVKKIGEKLSERYHKIHGIPIIPLKVTSETLAQYIDGLNSVPIGIDVKTGEVAAHDFESTTLLQILGNDVLFNQNFIENFLNVFKSIVTCQVKVLNFSRIEVNDEGLTNIVGEFTSAINGILEDEKNTTTKTVYFLVGLSKIYDVVLDEGIEMLTKILNVSYRFQNCRFVLIDNYPAYKKLSKEAWFVQAAGFSTLWLGNEVDVQNIVDAKRMTKGDINEDFRGLGYYFNGDEYIVIKAIGITGEM